MAEDFLLKESINKEEHYLDSSSKNIDELFEALKQKHPLAPEFLLKWMAKDLAGSAIASSVALKSFRPIWDNKEIARFLGWKGYFHEPGWLAGGQFKPMTPFVFEGQECKYLTPKSGYDAILLDSVDWNAIASDPKEKIIIAEGGKKAASSISLDINAIGLPGVDMGHPKGKRGMEMVPGLERFAQPDRPVAIAFDSDIEEKSGVQSALQGLAMTLTKRGCEVLVWRWPQSAGKGIDDVIAAGNFSQIEEISYAQWLSTLESESLNKTKTKKEDKLPASSVISERLCEMWKNHLAYDESAAMWRRWTGVYWEKQHTGGILSSISAYIRSNQWRCSSAFLSDCEKFLRLDLRKPQWESPSPSLVNFRNGVLDLKTGNLRPHSREDGFLYFLNRDYSLFPNKKTPLEILSANAPVFSEWLAYATGGVIKKQLRLLAAIAGVIRGEFARLQKFLHIYGSPGTGKGTFARLLRKIIGTANAESSSLRNLCGANPDYAISKIIHKRLVILPDEKKASKNLDVINTLTGTDPVDFRAPYGQPGTGTFYGTLCILSNGPIFAGDTSGVDRRLCLIDMNRQILKRDPEFEDKLDPEIGAITSAALALPIDQVRSLINADEDSAAIAWEQKCQASSMAEWMETSICYDAGAITRMKDLTDHYRNWCEEHGEIAVSHKKFAPLICEFSRDILKRQVTVTKKRFGNIVSGIRLATSSDPMISELFVTVGDGSVTVGDGSVTVRSGKSTPYTENGSANSVTDVTVFGQKLFGEQQDDWSPPPSNESVNPSQRVVLSNCDVQVRSADPVWSDSDIQDIVENLSLCDDKETFALAANVFHLDHPETKLRVWAAMTPEQKKKVKAVFEVDDRPPENRGDFVQNRSPVTAVLGKEYTLPTGERVVLLEFLHSVNVNGCAQVVGGGRYVRDKKRCEFLVSSLRE